VFARSGEAKTPSSQSLGLAAFDVKPSRLCPRCAPEGIRHKPLDSSSRRIFILFSLWRARRDSNPRPLEPESNALSS